MRSIPLFIFCLTHICSTGQEDPKKTWAELLDKPALASYFSGIFNQLGIIVSGTSYAFTVHHKETHFELTDGVDSTEADFVVTLNQENIRNMKSHGSDAINSTNDESVTHTLLFLNKTWVVIPGIQGEAKRIFRMKPEDALEYQRHVFRATNSDNPSGWRTFRKWYLKWRKTVSVVS